MINFAAESVTGWPTIHVMRHTTTASPNPPKNDAHKRKGRSPMLSNTGSAGAEGLQMLETWADTTDVLDRPHVLPRIRSIYRTLDGKTIQR